MDEQYSNLHIILALVMYRYFHKNEHYIFEEQAQNMKVFDITTLIFLSRKVVQKS